VVIAGVTVAIRRKTLGSLQSRVSLGT
jgi:hypothetical protein